MNSVNLEKKYRPTIKERGSMLKKDLRTNYEIYLLLIPVIVFYAIFFYMPMYGALMAFQDYAPRKGVIGSEWVGLKHFINFVTAPSFGTLMFNTLRISFSTLVVSFPAPIILALLMNELRSAKFARVVQTASYLPHFISLVIFCGLIKDFTSYKGVITYIMSLFGAERVSLLSYPQYFVPVYVLSQVWKEVGWGTIIYLAALTSVDPQLYEAAKIDGANKWQQLKSVTLPAITPTIVTMLILNMGSVLSVGYEKIILLANDATLEVADVISYYVYRKGILEQSWSFSTAVNLFNSLVNLVFLLGTNAISRKLNDTSLW